MFSYISCDMHRLLHRFSRWLMLLLGLSGLAVFTAIFGQSGLYGQWSSFAYISAVKALIKPLPLIVGVIEILFVFGDDLKAKTIQAAVGTGLRRPELICGKYAEIVLLSFFDVVIYGLLVLAMGLLFQAGLLGSQIQELTVYLLTEWLKVIGYTALTMIMIFFTRGVGLSLVLYIALYGRVLNAVGGYLLSLGPLENMHLGRYTMTASIDTLRTCLVGGAPVLGPLLTVLAYCAAGCLITVLVFDKRELEL